MNSSAFSWGERSPTPQAIGNKDESFFGEQLPATADEELVQVPGRFEVLQFALLVQPRHLPPVQVSPPVHSALVEQLFTHVPREAVQVSDWPHWAEDVQASVAHWPVLLVHVPLAQWLPFVHQHSPEVHVPLAQETFGVVLLHAACLQVPVGFAPVHV
jgi:hypothetical protein